MTTAALFLAIYLGLGSPRAGADGSGHPCEPILVGTVVVGRPGPRHRSPEPRVGRSTYATDLVVRAAEGDGDVRPAVEALVDAWVVERDDLSREERATILTELRATDHGGTDLWVPRIGTRIGVEWTAREPSRPSRIVRVDLPDRRKTRQRWLTRIETQTVPGGVRLAVERTVYRDDDRGEVRAVAFGARPSVIDRVLDESTWRVTSGRAPVRPYPMSLGPATVPAFVAAIRDPERTRPLVYVSLPIRGRTTPVDVERVAERLRGYAIVVVEHADDAAKALPVTGLLQKILGGEHVYDGAIAVFGPRGETWSTYRPDPKVDPAIVVDKIVRLATARALRQAAR